jgi:hypothetical protein
MKSRKRRNFYFRGIFPGFIWKLLLGHDFVVSLKSNKDLLNKSSNTKAFVYTVCIHYSIIKGETLYANDEYVYPSLPLALSGYCNSSTVQNF